MTNELNHRVKSTLPTLQIVVNQTFRTATSYDVARVALAARVHSLSATHDVLTQENWGSAASRPMGKLAENDQSQAYLCLQNFA